MQMEFWPRELLQRIKDIFTLPLSVINKLRIGLKFNLLLIKKTQPNNKTWFWKVFLGKISKSLQKGNHKEVFSSASLWIDEPCNLNQFCSLIFMLVSWSSLYWSEVLNLMRLKPISAVREQTLLLISDVISSSNEQDLVNLLQWKRSGQV